MEAALRAAKVAARFQTRGLHGKARLAAANLPPPPDLTPAQQDEWDQLKGNVTEAKKALDKFEKRHGRGL